MKLLFSIILLSVILQAQDKLETSKTSCIQQSLYPNKTLDEQKKILIEKAKQESLEELYGTLISSSTDIENGKMTSDKIRSRAVGTVRVDGNPLFHNGENFGEICTDLKVYITKKDLEKYRPKEVILHHYCFNDPSVSMKDIKKEAKYGAYKEILSQYKPSMKISKQQAEQFIHSFSISNDKFDFDTASYCFDAVGTILPYELELINEKTTVYSDNSIGVEKINYKTSLLDGTGELFNPYILNITNQTIKKEVKSNIIYFSLTLKEATRIRYETLGESVKKFYLYDENEKLLDEDYDYFNLILEEGTYKLKMISNSGQIKFNLFFGGVTEFENIENVYNLGIKNQTVKQKYNKKAIYYILKLNKTMQIRYETLGKTVKKFYLYDENEKLLDSDYDYFNLMLEEGTYKLKMIGNGSRIRFNLFFGGITTYTNINNMKNIPIRSQTIKQKYKSEPIYYRIVLQKPTIVKYETVDKSVKKFYLYDENEKLLDSDYDNFTLKLSPGIYRLKMLANGSRLKFNIFFN